MDTTSFVCETSTRPLWWAIQGAVNVQEAHNAVCKGSSAVMLPGELTKAQFLETACQETRAEYFELFSGLDAIYRYFFYCNYSTLAFCIYPN